jgi:hypothetical protein
MQIVLKSDLMDRLLAMVKVKEDKELKKTDGVKKKSGIAKLDDANFAVFMRWLIFRERKGERVAH